MPTVYREVNEMEKKLFESLVASIKQAGAIRRGEVKPSRVFNELADRSPGYVEETLESAGCTGGCPTYPGAPMTEDGYPDCSKCPERVKE